MSKDTTLYNYNSLTDLGENRVAIQAVNQAGLHDLGEDYLLFPMKNSGTGVVESKNLFGVFDGLNRGDNDIIMRNPITGRTFFSKTPGGITAEFTKDFVTKNGTDYSRSLAEILMECNRRIRELSQGKRIWMETSVSILRYNPDNNTLEIAYIGNSPIILIRDRKLFEIGYDSFSGILDGQTISSQSIRKKENIPIDGIIDILLFTHGFFPYPDCEVKEIVNQYYLQERDLVKIVSKWTIDQAGHGKWPNKDFSAIAIKF